MIRVHSVITNRTSEVDSTDDVTRIFSEIGGKCHLILQVFYDADMILIFLDFFFGLFGSYIWIIYLFFWFCFVGA